MPVVVNAGFSRSAGSALLHDDTARDRAVGELVSATESLGIIGWQLDFEGLHSSDRDVLSAFVGELAEALHRRGKMLSVAVAARTSDEPSETFYNFSGVYDYRALALAADFISVMAYPEHDGKHPGPLASYPWVNAVVLHVLDSAPADKVSLGLPTYQTDFSERRTRLVWHRRIRHRLHRFFRIVFLPVAHNGAADHGRKRLQWDPVLKSSYRVYGKGRRHHIIWVEDERSFKAKLEIVEKYHLRGFSVWRIGLEDPHIWTTLPDVERTSVQKSETAPEPALVGRAAGK
jgi:spore germination protein YaaH